MDAYIDRTVQLRDGARSQTSTAPELQLRDRRGPLRRADRGDRLGGACCRLGSGRRRGDRGRGHVGDRGGVARPGPRPAHRRRDRRPISRARGDRADHARGDAGGPRPDRGLHRRALSARAVHRARLDAGLGFHRRPVRDPLPLRVLARMDGASRASWCPRGDSGLLGSFHKCRQRAEPGPDRAARDDRDGARDRGGRRRVPGIARRRLGGVAHHRARRALAGGSGAAPRGWPSC